MIRVLATILTLATTPVDVDPNVNYPLCAKRSYYIDLMKNQYNEVLTVQAMGSKNQLVEFLVDPKSRDWTMLVTTQFEFGTITCMMATGHFWHLKEPVLDAPKS